MEIKNMKIIKEIDLGYSDIVSRCVSEVYVSEKGCVRMELTNKKLRYLQDATRKIQEVVQELFDKKNRERIEELEFYFYSIGNDLYYHLHRYPNFFDDGTVLQDSWVKRYENLHDSVELICPVLKEKGKLSPNDFERINREIYLFLLVSKDVEKRLVEILEKKSCLS